VNAGKKLEFSQVQFSIKVRAAYCIKNLIFYFFSRTLKSEKV